MHSYSPTIESDVTFPIIKENYDEIYEVKFMSVEYRGLSFKVSELHYDWVTRNEKHVMTSLYDAVINLPISSRGIRSCLVLDVGMNDGFYTIMATKLGCDVVSFELQEKCIRVASQGLRINGNESKGRVTIVHRPVAESDDLLLTLPYDRNWCSGVFGFAHSDCGEMCNPQFETTKTFRSVSLQSRFGAEERKIINFLKIDVEGLDNEVLKGSVGLFRSKRILNAVVEIGPHIWRQNVNEPVTIHNWIIFEILSYGYSIQCLTFPSRYFNQNESRNDLWDFVHSKSCVDYLLAIANPS